MMSKKKKSGTVSLEVDSSPRVAKSTGKSYAKDAIEKKINKEIDDFWKRSLAFDDIQW